MTKRELVDMFKNIIFPKQAEDLLKINYEGLGELDKREFLRDTLILIMLAEKGLKSEQAPRWIPVSEGLPKDIKPVQITWKNNDPEPYYQDIKGKHFTGTAHYKDGKWYWYSDVTEDFLAEYGRCDICEFDSAIEVVAWMPMAEPYEAGSEVEDGNNK